MSYLSLRLQIYRQELAQLLSAIRDLGIFIAAVCYQLIIPLFLILPIFWVGQIAQTETSPQLRALYQGGYLILTYALMRIQAKALLGTSYNHYLQSLIISPWQKIYSHVLLCLVAGNLMIISPLIVCWYIPDLDTLVSHSYIVSFTLANLIVSQIALFSKNFPAISLVSLPIIGYVNDYTTSHWFGLFWLTIIIVEVIWLNKVSIQKPPMTLRYYLQLLYLFAKHRLTNIIARTLATILLITAIYYLLLQRPDLDAPLIDWLLICPLALFIGSYQFEIERFRSQYQYYLLSLPVDIKIQRRFDLVPLWLFSLLPIGLGIGFLQWQVDIAAMQLILIAITAWGVHAWGRYYFIANLIASGLLVVLLTNLH